MLRSLNWPPQYLPGPGLAKTVRELIATFAEDPGGRCSQVLLLEHRTKNLLPSYNDAEADGTLNRNNL
jgi:hypothetical protein